MAESSGSGEVLNRTQGDASGQVVQAGSVRGGVHFHAQASPSPPALVPRQLPAPPANFVAREAELAAVDRAWADRGDRYALVLLTGAAGIGKSALALRWAQLATDRFPDGQLFADLGAFTPGGPVDPAEVLAGFLRSLGLAPEWVPTGTAEQAGLFRTVTADKRILIVLDNAVSAAQVRSLLPGSPVCMVLITAGWRLGALIGEGAEVVEVPPLPPHDATDLLRRTIGAARLDGDPGAAATLVELCEGLPIALAVTGARLASRPGWPIRRLADQLSREHHRLSGLSTHPDLSVRSTFDLAYQALDPRSQACYRVLGLHPGARPGTAVVATALRASPDETADTMDVLVEANLVTEVAEHRYRLHDLVRLHARDQARDDPSRAELLARITQWYLAGTRAADHMLTPYRRRTPPADGEPDVPEVVFAGRADALEWLEWERTNLVAVVGELAEQLPETVWRIADGMWALFLLGRHHHDRMHVDRIAVDCARRLGNRGYESRMVRRWAFAHFDGGLLDEARRLFVDSLALCEQLDDRYGCSASLEGLGAVALAQRRFDAAAEYFSQELVMCQALGERRRAGLALVNLGTVENARGQPTGALAYLNQARVAFHELGDLDRYNSARLGIELGKALAGAGDDPGGLRELAQALADMRALGSPRGQAQALHAWGELLLAAGRHPEAGAALTEAAAIYERLGDVEAEQVRALVALLPPTETDPHGMPAP